jgi:hypothetical protein
MAFFLEGMAEWPKTRQSRARVRDASRLEFLFELNDDVIINRGPAN